MSRPANPSFSVPGWTIPTWAPSASYPAGVSAWSSMPTKVAHPGASSVGFTPRTGVPAQAMNKVLNDAYATDDAAKTYCTTLRGEVSAKIDELITHIGAIQARNWSAPSSTTNLRRVAFDSDRYVWLATTNDATNDIAWSGDGGKSWTTIAAGGGLLGAIGCDNSGNVVALSTSGAHVYEYNKSTTTWTNRAGVLTSSTGYDSSFVRYEPTSGLWSVVYFDSGATLARFFTSADRVTWTNRGATGPTSFSATGRMPAAMGVGNGRIVVVGAVGSNPASFVVASSADGGINWTSDQTITFAGGLAYRASVAYSPDDGVWLLAVSSASPTTDLYVSSDGVTWTLRRSWTNYSMKRIAVIGRMWVAIGDYAFTSTVAYSLDAGVTWRKAGALASTVSTLAASDEGLVALLNDTGAGGHSRGCFVTGEGGTTL